MSLSRIHYCYIILTKECRKKSLSFPLSWEFQTPISFLRAPDPFLLLGDPGLLIDLPRNWLFHPPSPILLGELCCQGKGASFLFHNYFLLLRGVGHKLLRQHILLTLILRVSDPGAPSSSGGGCGTRRSLDNHLQLKSFLIVRNKPHFTVTDVRQNSH